MAALFCATLCAQTPDKIVFEVASVKLSAGPPPNPPGGYKIVPGQVPPIRPDQRRLDVQHGRLNSLLTRAYDIQYADIVGPSWMESEYYDIHAKVPDSAPNGQVPEMLKNLLIERFHMMVHWDVKEVSGYRLAVGNSGAKLTRAPDDTPKSIQFTRAGHFAWKANTLAEVAQVLSRFLDRPVSDATGLPGKFNIEFDAAPDSLPGLASNEESTAPSIFAAVKSLGLELEPFKVEVKHLVVDSADKKPTEN